MQNYDCLAAGNFFTLLKRNTFSCTCTAEQMNKIQAVTPLCGGLLVPARRPVRPVSHAPGAVSYTHLTLPTIYSV